MKAHMPVSSKSLARAYHVPPWPEVEVESAAGGVEVAAAGTGAVVEGAGAAASLEDTIAGERQRAVAAPPGGALTEAGGTAGDGKDPLRLEESTGATRSSGAPPRTAVALPQTPLPQEVNRRRSLLIRTRTRFGDEIVHFKYFKGQMLGDVEKLGTANRYEVLKLLGDGTFGRVLLCKDKVSKKEVAVKVT
eukprot:s2575_g5.t1